MYVIRQEADGLLLAVYFRSSLTRILLSSRSVKATFQDLCCFVVTIVVHTNDFTQIRFVIRLSRTQTQLKLNRFNVKRHFISAGVSKTFECSTVSRFVIQLLCGEFFSHDEQRSYIQPRQGTSCGLFVCVRVLHSHSHKVDRH